MSRLQLQLSCATSHISLRVRAWRRTTPTTAKNCPTQLPHYSSRASTGGWNGLTTTAVKVFSRPNLSSSPAQELTGTGSQKAEESGVRVTKCDVLLAPVVRTDKFVCFAPEHQSLYLRQSGVLQNHIFCCSGSPLCRAQSLLWQRTEVLFVFLPRRRQWRSVKVCAQTHHEFWLSLLCPWREWYFDTLHRNLQADDASVEVLVELQIVLLPFIHVHSGDRALARLFLC